jgi:hypothetical protein
MLVRVSHTINLYDLLIAAHGVDARRSAARLIEQTASAWRLFLSGVFPGAEIDIRLGVNEIEHVSPNHVFVEYGIVVPLETVTMVEHRLSQIALDVFMQYEWLVASETQTVTS